ncbi:MAG: tetratricopeptide repeat protein [Gammaproteobacteria bacterium]
MRLQPPSPSLVGLPEHAKGLLSSFKSLAETRVRGMLASVGEEVVSQGRASDGADAGMITDDHVADGLFGLGPVFCWDDAEAIWEIEKSKVFPRKARKTSFSKDMTLSSYVSKADQLYRDGKIDDALDAYLAVEGQNKSPDFTLMITEGNLRLFRLGDVQTARNYYQRADKMLDGKHLYFRGYALLHLALCSHYLGERDRAANLAKQVVSLTPDFQEARYQYAQYEALRGRPNDAFRELTRLIKENRLYVLKIFSDATFEPLYTSLIEHLATSRDELIESQRPVLSLADELLEAFDPSVMEGDESSTLREELNSNRQFVEKALQSSGFLDAHAVTERIGRRFKQLNESSKEFALGIDSRRTELKKSWRRIQDRVKQNSVRKQRLTAVLSLLLAMGGCTAMVVRSHEPDNLIAAAGVALALIVLGGLVSISIPVILARNGELKEIAQELKGVEAQVKVADQIVDKIGEHLARDRDGD